VTTRSYDLVAIYKYAYYYYNYYYNYYYTWKVKSEKDCTMVYLCRPTHLHKWSANYTFSSNILRVTGRMGTIADFAVKPFGTKTPLQTSQSAWNCFQHIDWLVLTLNENWKKIRMPQGQRKGLEIGPKRVLKDQDKAWLKSLRTVNEKNCEIDRNTLYVNFVRRRSIAAVAVWIRLN